MKKRLDQLVCELDPSLSRSRAQSLIMSGDVYVNNQKELKSGSMFPEDARIEIRGKKLKYVSRGGLKLEKALSSFHISLSGRVCMDIGSSTGGFTDCMLQNGAAKVYAVDVGYGQLAWKLRTDARVVNLERTNLRYVTREQIPEELDLAVMDVSFISIRLVLPAVKALLKPGADYICLIKPQFEAGRGKVGKKGVVRDRRIHREVIEEIIQFAETIGWRVSALDYSPITGPEGNIEFLAKIVHRDDDTPVISSDFVEELVERAHGELGKGGGRKED